MSRKLSETPSFKRLKKGGKPGDILLFYRARGINRIITWFSGSCFYHVGIYAGEEYVVESRPNGVVRRDLRIPGSGRHFLIIPAPEGKGEAALEWAGRQLGDDYAALSVLAMIIDRMFKAFRPNIPQPGSFSCGEFVVKAFEVAGVRLFPERPAELIAPWDFARLLSHRLRRWKERRAFECRALECHAFKQSDSIVAG